jgi:hypothetical protein
MAVRLALAKLGAGSAGAEDGDAAGMPVYGTRVTINTGVRAIAVAYMLNTQGLPYALASIVRLPGTNKWPCARLHGSRVYHTFCQTQAWVVLTC